METGQTKKGVFKLFDQGPISLNCLFLKKVCRASSEKINVNKDMKPMLSLLKVNQLILRPENLQLISYLIHWVISQISCLPGKDMTKAAESKRFRTTEYTEDKAQLWGRVLVQWQRAIAFERTWFSMNTWFKVYAVAVESGPLKVITFVITHRYVTKIQKSSLWSHYMILGVSKNVFQTNEVLKCMAVVNTVNLIL